MIPFLVCVLLLSPPPPTYNLSKVINAIQKVETGGSLDPSNAVGDNGKAIGPYQIHLCYWKDAVDYDKTIGGKYSDCKDEEYARKIVEAYLCRYCKVYTNENVARIHNGGPQGHKRSSTVGYWKKVNKELNNAQLD